MVARSKLMSGKSLSRPRHVIMIIEISVFFCCTCDLAKSDQTLASYWKKAHHAKEFTYLSYIQVGVISIGLSHNPIV